VVSGIEPPADLGLPRLGPWSGGEPPDVSLAGAAATPSRVLAELAKATTIELHAHGLPNLADADASFVVLSSDVDGRYALTAGDVREVRLAGAPLVILAACHAARTAPHLHEPWSLPVAFLDAGARSVVASSTTIPDAEAGPFFEGVRRRISAGESPAAAVRHERETRPYQKWMSGVMVFE
jgi:hypothetical protein